MTAPFIRSAGGKREQASFLISLMPQKFDTYVEPFIGGGAVFFALRNEGRLDGKTVILGDGDPDLIALYAAVRDDPTSLAREAGRLIDLMAKTSDPQAFFEDQRKLWNAGKRTPGRHLFLRSACYNGIWRTNQDGEMNVPWKKATPKPPDLTQLRRAAESLKGVELVDWDFRRYEENAEDDNEEGGGCFVGEGTVVYLDPPYLTDGGWVGYLPAGWSEPDFVTLLHLCRIWSDRGAHVVLSHAGTPEALMLRAQHWPDAVLHKVLARRSVNSDGEGRGPVEEMVAVSAALDMSPAIMSSSTHGEDARPE